LGDLSLSAEGVNELSVVDRFNVQFLICNIM